MRLTKIWIKLRNVFWFTPTIYCIIALILVIGIHLLDERMVTDANYQFPELVIISEETARGLYTALVTAILTMTTISFSVIMVVLTTYSSQFSPRTLQDFIQSKMTHHVLGVFSFGFIFSLVNLVLMGKHDTIIGPIVMVIIAIVCLAFFIYFIHHAAKWLQVSSLVEFIHHDSARVIKAIFTNKKFGEHETWKQAELNRIKQHAQHQLRATNSGYIQKIDWESIVEWAKQNNCVIKLHQLVGDYVTKDLSVLTALSPQQLNNMGSIRKFIVIGNERTDIEDIEFNIQKLVEIAVKAVSPSINDPDTARNCINRIGSVLSELGKGFKDIRYLTDDSGELRLIKESKQYEDYLYKSFYQIVFYGKEDVSICYSLLEVLLKMALVSKNEIKRKIWAFHYYVVNAIEWDKLHDLDKQHLETIYKQLEKVCKN